MWLHTQQFYPTPKSYHRSIAITMNVKVEGRVFLHGWQTGRLMGNLHGFLVQYLDEPALAQGRLKLVLSAHRPLHVEEEGEG